ncbi:unnamed protein product [Polarella glacialis]|uniref:Uncharacterized protein n=1 Tax=Polarella glacialis TaxID=89957 RepID=A0A813DMB5_POLGL|nr:unnamed protein product [Polarella glacialis]
MEETTRAARVEGPLLHVAEPPKAESATGPAAPPPREPLEARSARARLEPDFGARKHSTGEALTEGEQLALLKQYNHEAERRTKRLATRELERQRQLAEDYRDRSKARAEQARQERQQRLSSLRRSANASASSASCLSQELSIGEEYRDLMDRYGSRLRVPSLPPSQTSSTMTSIIEGSHGYSIDSAPRITPRKRPRVPKTPRVRQPSGQLSSRQAEPPLDGLEDMTAIAEASSPRQLPRVSGVGSPEVGRSSFLTAVPAPGVSPGKVASPAVPLPPVVHAHGSLMPRKDQLRKQQQALLKSTEVVFYKRQMKAHLQRILAAVELTFDDSSPEHWKAATSNLAKPRNFAHIDSGNMSSILASGRP